MTAPIAHHLKTAHAGLAGEQALQAPVDVLLGVSAGAKAALEPLHITTVFELAASQLFATAALLLEAETNPSLAEARMNTAAADAVNPPPGVPLGEWARHDLGILAGMTPAQAADLRTALDVSTVRDLALWPPYRAARNILQDTLGVAAAAAAADPDAPAELQPRSGSHATERVFFRKLVIDLAPQADQTAAPLEQLTGIDLASALAAPTGFQRLATGALLTFQQSWFSQGVTLGQLLHSLSLAPGESTRVAVVDWTRTSSARASESIDERERLASEQTHTRALSEVTESTASEFQAGASRTSVKSSTSQSGGALGLELGPLALGGSHGGSSSTTEAMSASSSFGARDMAASLGQEINDRTQQHSSAARTRRASAVREVSQSEHETITTRVVTNYNHMHALTVQYYETVQAYRVTTELHRAERCLFVPLKLLDFQVPATVDHLRTSLADAALTPAAFRQLTSEYGAVEIIPQTPRVIVGNVGLADVLVRGAVLTPVEPGGAGAGGATPVGGGRAAGGLIRGTAGTLAGAAVARETGAPEAGAVAGDAGPPVGGESVGALALERIRFDQGPANTPVAVAAVKGWNLAQLNRLASLAGRIVLRRNSDSAFVPHDALLLGVALREGQSARFQIRSREDAELPAHFATPTSLVLAQPVAFSSVKVIALQNAQERDLTTMLVLSVNVNGSVVALDVPVQFKSRTTTAGLQEVVRFGEVGPAPELTEHLQANRLHYSRAVFQRLDEAAIGGLLARFTYKGLALGRVVDPRPVAVTSNFLVFRVHVPLDGGLEDERFASEQAEFKAFLAQRGLDRPMPQSQIVPLPSGGVFAEAVLGRFNSAEKIDLKRFWNWQDSPIPITAPEIAPISAGSRAEDENLRPGQLGAPMVTIQAPTALPGAGGVGPILSAIQTANLFRDMSGMAQTAALAQSAVAASGAGATSAGEIAAQNLKTTMEQRTARMKIAADMLGSMMGAGAGGGGGGGSSSSGSGAGAGSAPAGRGTVSERGGELRAAEAIDQKASASGATSGAAPGTLAQETLAQQTGSDLRGAAEKVVETATAPEPKVTPRTTPRTGTSPAPKPSTPATPAPPGQPPPEEPDLRHYRMEIDFGTTSGTAFGGERQARVTTLFEQLGEARSGPGFPLVITFQTKAEFVQLEISVAPKAGADLFKTTKQINLRTLFGRALDELDRSSSSPLGRLLTGPSVRTISVGVRPSLREKTFKVGFVALQPDVLDLERQLSEAGVKPSQRIGEPEFVFTTGGYNAKVRWISRTPIVEQFF